MAKSVGMARLAVRRWKWPIRDNAGGWLWTNEAWAIYQHAKRYLRQYAQRRR